MTTSGTGLAAELRARRLHLALLVILASGLGVWLWRVYGFIPLRVTEAPLRGAGR